MCIFASIETAANQVWVHQSKIEAWVDRQDTGLRVRERSEGENDESCKGKRSTHTSKCPSEEFFARATATAVLLEIVGISYLAGLAAEELLHRRNVLRHSIRRQAFQKHPPVARPLNPRIEQHQHATVFERANQPPKALLQCNDR